MHESMRSRENEIREKISNEISTYLNVKNKELTIYKLTSYASKAILYEIIH